MYFSTNSTTHGSVHVSNQVGRAKIGYAKLYKVVNADMHAKLTTANLKCYLSLQMDYSILCLLK